ncbi:M20/M25/M40 family metallo-hydrolase [Naasia lichenicola]|uniref:M20/M25/M40 family metallo-hydrolase n=1 Tax=Naasia lichenicola TaxID=2565933 RepID=A0A4S4FKI5_9MICO|nr:M20/M25/M40 family metallo-hydrolase [Naasia lichenicola]THG30648.1 M20/M25/M40 family metallo-hydrolase [Naasia lichenicola]THG31885.1 M20/M25/M40 family metallo-hydrolase [Naasia lichenicola]
MLNLLDAAIAAHTESAFAFLEDLVRAPSLVGSEQTALDVFARELTAIGLEVQLLPFPAEPFSDPRGGVSPRPQDLYGTGNAAGRYQVVGRTPGDGPLTLLLNGHIDVVPATDSILWRTAPFEPDRRDGRMYGRGTADMKGGFAIGMLALRALKDVAPDLFSIRRLGFLAVIEEECTGNGALNAASEHGVLADEVVLLEPTDLGLMLGGVGVLWLEVEVTGHASHAESADSTSNAIDLGMRLVAALRAWSADLSIAEPDPALPDTDHPYNLNLGRITAGDWNSSAPSRATLGLRMGFPRSWDPARAERELRAFIQKVTDEDSDFPAQPVVRASGFRASGYLLDEEDPLVRDLRAAHLDAHGDEPRLFSLGSTTDARTYINHFGTPAVCFGAIAHDMHGVDESVELQSIVDGARTLARFLLARFAETEATA